MARFIQDDNLDVFILLPFVWVQRAIIYLKFSHYWQCCLYEYKGQSLYTLAQSPIACIAQCATTSTCMAVGFWL